MLPLELHLKFAGLLLILLGLSHAFFGQRFHWKQELERVSLLNRQIFYVHAFFIALVVVMLGVLALFYTGTLIEKTALARVVLGGSCFSGPAGCGFSSSAIVPACGKATVSTPACILCFHCYGSI